MVGFFNVYAHSKSVISIAPNIIEDFRRKGFGAFGLEKVIEKVRILGYKIAIATIFAKSRTFFATITVQRYEFFVVSFVKYYFYS